MPLPSEEAALLEGVGIPADDELTVGLPPGTDIDGLEAAALIAEEIERRSGGAHTSDH